MSVATNAKQKGSVPIVIATLIGLGGLVGCQEADFSSQPTASNDISVEAPFVEEDLDASPNAERREIRTMKGAHL